MIARILAGVALLLAVAGGVQSQQPAAAYSGTFSSLDGHGARGGVRLQSANGTATVTLGRDFASERGPNVDLYLSKSPSYKDRKLIRLGDLRRHRGAQSFTARAPADLAQYRYVIAWCHTFNVGIARAALAPAR